MRAELRAFFEEHTEEVFFSKQLEVRNERKYFHWLTNRALHNLIDEGFLRCETRQLKTVGVTLDWDRLICDGDGAGRRGWAPRGQGHARGPSTAARAASPAPTTSRRGPPTPRPRRTRRHRVRTPQGEVQLVYIQVSKDTFIELQTINAQRPAGIYHFGVVVEDIAQATAMWKARGADVREITPSSGTKAILSNIYDPNGVRMELLQLPPDSLHAQATNRWK